MFYKGDFEPCEGGRIIFFKRLLLMLNSSSTCVESVNKVSINNKYEIDFEKPEINDIKNIVRIGYFVNNRKCKDIKEDTQRSVNI